jgi:hypothetical protein
MASEDLPARPRRERPLVAPGRAPREDAVTTPPPPSVTTPPVGPPLFSDMSQPAPKVEREDHVYVSFEGPLPQNRWTVAFRVFLAIPHFVWSYLLNIAYQVVLVIAWVGAVFIGRMPSGLGEFIGRYVRYQARLYGYMLLLTDKYPPFEDDAGETYAVNVAFNPGPLNRLSVLFRLILAVPGFIVMGLVGAGVMLVLPVAWLLTLILGRLPTPLWEAHAAYVRYSTRFIAFVSLLTAEQPSGLFGDKAESPGGQPELSSQPVIRTLVLSQAAKRLLVFFMIAAAVVWISIISLVAIFGTRLADSYEKLDDSYQELSLANSEHTAGVQQCAVSGGGIACLRPNDAELADAFDEFSRNVAAIEWPANLQPEQLLVDAQACADALRLMASAESQDAYNAAADVYREAEAGFLASYDEFAGTEFE